MRRRRMRRVVSWVAQRKQQLPIVGTDGSRLPFTGRSDCGDSWEEDFDLSRPMQSRDSRFLQSFIATAFGAGRTRKAALLVAAVASLFVTWASAYGQGPDTTYFLHERLRGDGWGWFAAPPSQTDYGYMGSLLRFGVTQRVHRWDWQLELSQPTLLGLPSGAVSPVAAQGQLGLGATYYAANGKNSDPAAAFLKSGWVQYRFGHRETSLRLGRFEFFDGAETQPRNQTVAWLQANRVSSRLIGPFGFSNAQRSFDGAAAHLDAGAWNVAALAARADQGVFNMNGNPELNVDVQYLALTRTAARGHVLARAFGMGYHDGRTGILKVDNRPLAVRQADHKNIRLGTYGGNLLAAIPAGRGSFDLLFWGVLQSGRWGNQSDYANAAAVEGGYRFDGVASKPWVRGGWFRSSGDDRPLDGRHTTFFQVLTTPRPYARFPFYNLMNNTDEFIQAIDVPAKALTLRGDIHWLSLTSGGDLWYHGGGAFDNKVFGYAGQPSSGRTRLSTVVDLSADWKVTEHIGMNFYYAHATAGSVIQPIFPAAHGAQFGFAELDYHWQWKH